MYPQQIARRASYYLYVHLYVHKGVSNMHISISSNCLESKADTGLMQTTPTERGDCD